MTTSDIAPQSMRTQEQIKKSNRITLIAIFGVFAAPVLLAYLAYFGGWFEGRQTFNKGELLSPPVQLSQHISDEDLNNNDVRDLLQNWLIFYVNNQDECDGRCERALEISTKVHYSLGKESKRAKTLLLSAKKPPMLSNSYKELFSLQSKGVDKPIPAGYIYVSDPRGFVILRYVVPEKDLSQMSTRFKEILKDLKKIMKYSVVG